MLLELKKVKKFSHVYGEDVQERYDLDNATERYYAHKFIDTMIENYERKTGLEESIEELYSVHSIISEQKSVDMIIDLGEWDLFVESK